MKPKMSKCLGIGAIIAGLAAGGLGLWLLLRPAHYLATARIRVKHTSSPGVFSDPFFIETEFQVIGSQVVLGRVVEALNLNAEWGRKYAGGMTLKTPESVRLLRQRLDLHRVAMTEDCLEIGVNDENPVEAAQIVNAIAKTYLKYLFDEGSQALKYGNYVTIVDPAVQPGSPTGPRHLLGSVLLLCSLAEFISGFYLISSAAAIGASLDVDGAA